MAKQYIYAPANPIWMNEVTTFNAAYNTIPFDYQKAKIPYSQKVKFAFPTKLQVLSDWVPTLKIYQCGTGTLIDTLSGATPTTGVVGQTFTVYEFTITWGSYPADTYYIEITYDANSGISASTYSLTEDLAPFIDGNLHIVNDGVTIKDVFSNVPISPISLQIGKSYSFIADATETSTATNPRIRLTVKKDGVVIFDQSEVQTDTVSITYSGIVQPESVYDAKVVTEDTADVVTPINIADNNAVIPDTITNRSGAIQSATNWPGTLVYQYSNSQNDFSIIWSTGIIMCLVVEGAIADYEPGFDDIIYEDQLHNTTKLNSIPFRQFTLYAGSATGFAGMPTYIGDKINWVFACDQVKIDGVYYQNTDGSKWEVNRTDPNGTNFIGLKITIIEVINLFLQSYQAGQIPAGSVKVVDRVLDYVGNSANITVTGIFTAASLLTKIIIYNNGGDIFTINASTAPDGSAPVAPPFTTTGAPKDVWVIDEPFDAVSTLYLLGLAGTNCDIYIRYDQLDAPYIVPPVPFKPHVKNTRYSYEEVTIGDFAVDWNIGTGLGNVGGRYEGCAISGTNGTEDMNGLLELGWDSSMPLTRDMLVGNVGNTVAVTQANLPNIDLNTDAAIRYKHGTAQNGGNPTQGLSSVNQNGEFQILLGGSNVPLDISNRARVTLRYVCITD